MTQAMGGYRYLSGGMPQVRLLEVPVSITMESLASRLRNEPGCLSNLRCSSHKRAERDCEFSNGSSPIRSTHRLEGYAAL